RVQVSKIEPLVWDSVRPLLSDPARLPQRYAEGCGDPALDRQEEHERQRLTRKLAAVQREVQRLIDASQAAVIELPELQQRRQRIEEHGRLRRDRLREVDTQRATRESEMRLLAGAETFCASVRDGLADPPVAIKQRILQFVVDRIVVEDGRLVVQHVVPTGP